ncbi:polyprenol monophosphomannose synthase [Candidatus Nanopelagicales bacterium]|nr:polyprenol monophosphomannose synthase [Candidatus Nanopelagicales bacterium]
MEREFMGETTNGSSEDTVPLFGDLGRIVVVVPTYNEKENVARITARILQAVPETDILVADDNSPDGTGDIADQLADDDSRIHVMHRMEKAGLGAAYLAGFDWALDNSYDVIVEMDADGSHRPEDLPRLLTRLRTADLVLGSRWVDGGEVVNWPMSREVLSRGGNLYTRWALQVPMKDATGGFRAFRADTLRALNLDSIESQGYVFQVDLATRVHRLGLDVAEVPISFEEREFGTSKMSQKIVAEALWRVTVWGYQARVSKLRAARRRARDRKARKLPPGPSSPAESFQNQNQQD